MTYQLSVAEQLALEPGLYETTKYCPDCGKLRGISAFTINRTTNKPKSKYCRVHSTIRKSIATKLKQQAYEAAYQQAKNND